MSTTPALKLRNTLPMRRFANILRLLAVSALAVYLTHVYLIPTVHNIALLVAFASFVALIAIMFTREDFDDTNIENVTQWAWNKYGIRLSRKQSSELVMYGNAEFGNDKYMLQLCLIERNGEFSLHRTRELEVSEEKDNIGKRQ